MNLSIASLTGIKGMDLPEKAYFDLPEKVIQFGTGVLLRGLPDYFIDKANKRGIFNGRIVVVKSTGHNTASAFDEQQGLFTHCIRGIQGGLKVEEDLINASISRVLSARTQWREILNCAASPSIQVIISNTTEVGITLTPDDLQADPPVSFPGKLLAFLVERYRIFGQVPGKGLVIVPTELIPDNADRLKSILLELCRLHGLADGFMDWLERENYFCNSLVDRIVPGKLPAKDQQDMEIKYDYSDELMIMSEPYALWAIESGHQRVKEVLCFWQADPGVIIAPDIYRYRQLKLRLLNGSHTFSCGLAVLCGFSTVKQAMEDPRFRGYISALLLQEIVPSITGDMVSSQEAEAFALQVIDRFSNPFIEHQWLSITMQYSSKMATRNVPVLLAHMERYGRTPAFMTMGFAAHLLFMRGEKAPDNSYHGVIAGKKYLINDDNAAYYSDCWQNKDLPGMVREICGNEALWKTNLASLPEFAEEVTRYLQIILEQGAYAAILHILN